VDSDRLEREIILWAEKLDITEELVRLASHIEMGEGLLTAGSQGTGKKFEFLVQEMGREVNTIASKSADTQLAYLVIEFKTALEKIKEQLQNIE
jgi:uncharacterized protein (TIGR00255 family)